MELCRELLALGGLDGRRPGRRRCAAARPPSASPRWSPSSAGPADLLERPDDHLPAAPARSPPPLPERAGIVAAVDVRAVGLAVVALGGGRRHEAEAVDHAVGLSEVAAPGERVGPADAPLAVVHARTEADAEAAIAALRAAFTVGDEAPADAAAILERWSAS